MSPGGPPVVRAYQEGDEIALNKLWNRVHGTTRSLDEWSWLYPPDEGGRMIVVAEDDHGIAAACAGRPLRVAVHGREWKAVEIHEILIEPRADGGEIDDFRDRVVGGLFDIFCRGQRRHLALSAVHLEGGMPRQFGGQPMRRIPVLVRERAATPPMARFRYRAELARDWEPRLDDLWNRVCERYKVAVIRDADHAMRRFSGHPTVRYHRFLILPRFADRAVAFAVFSDEGDCCRWQDLVWDDAHPGALELVAHISGRLAARSNAVVEELWLAGDGAARELLESRGFRAVKAATPVVTARSLDPELDGQTFLRRAYLTMADVGGPPP